MNDSDFQQLLASVKEAGRIKRGEQEPSRQFEVKAEDINAASRESPARALLKVAAVNSRAVTAALDPSQAASPGFAADGSRRR